MWTMADPATQLSILQNQLETVKSQLSQPHLLPSVRVHLLHVYYNLQHRIDQLLDIINFQFDGISRALMPQPKNKPKRK